ncbi:MAG TPA: hypothetical protein VD735_00915 [Candidatus Saccharimonadales bacterium]|nr:hypothetical protein [Candidatus Saccharimonadales bacterium]
MSDIRYAVIIVLLAIIAAALVTIAVQQWKARRNQPQTVHVIDEETKRKLDLLDQIAADTKHTMEDIHWAAGAFLTGSFGTKPRTGSRTRGRRPSTEDLIGKLFSGQSSPTPSGYPFGSAYVYAGSGIPGSSISDILDEFLGAGKWTFAGGPRTFADLFETDDRMTGGVRDPFTSGPFGNGLFGQSGTGSPYSRFDEYLKDQHARHTGTTGTQNDKLGFPDPTASADQPADASKTPSDETDPEATQVIKRPEEGEPQDK